MGGAQEYRTEFDKGPGYQPYSTGAQLSSPGADPYAGQRTQMGTPGAAAQTPVGWDFSSPGVAEQTFQQQQQRFMQPGQAQQWWGANQGQYQQPGEGEQYYSQMRGKFADPTASEGAYAQYQQGPAGLDPYYDRQRTRAAADINNQLSARGGFGSTVGTQQISDAMVGLGAEQANREAAFRLQQQQLGGQLAGQADAQRMAQMGLGQQMASGAQQLGLSRLGQAGGYAMGLDQFGFQQLAGQLQAAQMAQQARRTRGQDYFSNIYNPAMAAMGLSQQGLNALISGDQSQIDSMVAMMMSRASEQARQVAAAKEQKKADIAFAGSVKESIDPL